MTAALRVLSAGPGLSIQDKGRPGYLGVGLSQGGAADPLALAEAAALLGQDPNHAVLEMAGFGGRFQATSPLTIALTGAPMQATVDGVALRWNASHALLPDQTLDIGGARQGVYGYLGVAGGFATPDILGSRSWHSTAGLGTPISAGNLLPIALGRAAPGMGLEPPDRFTGGTVHMIESAQTHQFPPKDRARFQATVFHRDPRGNRQGVRFAQQGDPFGAAAGLKILSEIIVPGDIQISGEGDPFVLLADCQTTGGYPRIGTVIPCDLPKIAQAPPGAEIRFKLVTLDQALALDRAAQNAQRRLPQTVRPLIRAPQDIPDLLSYQLISGVTTGEETP